ncbi:hypothetical protein NIES267_65180 [Calothrix parasitica NIES-267]|uniref:DUF952 domain-containing protein n=1 Tax=Calothrix parasitica NIES-267 TaxID=1973488 RepID=A0A1Z4M0N0_9CYAN|nr:hypothetical protein NIES267_65180 [Calothrix parasitica NIES-267]
MTTIFHITLRQDWEKATSQGTYRADSLETEGFIHCSTSTQLVRTANKFFKNQTDLLLLFIDSDKVKAEIRYDFVTENETFPHIYGALNLDAVFKVINFEADKNGLFKLPPEVQLE